jgi:hypothetical protein
MHATGNKSDWPSGPMLTVRNIAQRESAFITTPSR